MGKNKGKKKKEVGGQSVDGSPNQTSVVENSPKAYDKDTEVFIGMAQELKDEGNKLFQKRDHEGALLKYEKALKLLPKNHIDVSYLRSNMAACYMQMGLSECPRAIHECNLALEVTPLYSKALLKRARCYEALNRLDLALKDVTSVLIKEPKNIMAVEIADRVKKELEKRGLRVNDTVIELPPEYAEPTVAAVAPKVVKERTKNKKKKKKCNKVEQTKAEDKVEETKDKVEETNIYEKIEDKRVTDAVIEFPPDYVESPPVSSIASKVVKEKIKKKKSNELEQKKVEDTVKQKKVEENIEDKRIDDRIEEKMAEDKVVVKEKISHAKGIEPKKIVKLVFGEDIRVAQLPLNCSLLQLTEVVRDRYPSLRALLIKYRDEEGDLVTITTDEELRWAEASAEMQGCIKLYIVEVYPHQDPLYEKFKNEMMHSTDIGQKLFENGNVEKAKEAEKGLCCIDDWVVEFAQLFKDHVGLDSDTYLNLHELGMKVYSEAMEEAVTSEEAQGLFNRAAEKFQEMAALALFNWGNIHMSRARKGVYLKEEASQESVLEQIKSAYDWAQKEFATAGQKYEEALKIKPDFYEAILALGQQQFEQAKLSWYYAVSNNVDFDTWSKTEVPLLYNNAENNMEKGMQMWDEMEGQRLSELFKQRKVDNLTQRTGLHGLFKDISVDEAEEQARNIRSQINILWGTILYERSIMEYKMGIPVWQESLEVAFEKFELAGASPTDIAVMIKNHCSKNDTGAGLGFQIDEIVLAWNEMYEARKWQSGISSLRLEPLLRRRVSKLQQALDHA